MLEFINHLKTILIIKLFISYLVIIKAVYYLFIQAIV